MTETSNINTGTVGKIAATQAAISTPADQTPAQPAPINASVLQGWLISFAIALVAISGMWSTALHYWQARDLSGALNWMRSNDFVGALAPVVAAAGILSMIYRTYLNVRIKAWLARRLPNDVAYVVGEEQPLLPPRAPETATPRTRLVGMPIDPRLTAAPAPSFDLPSIEAAVQDIDRALGEGRVVHVPAAAPNPPPLSIPVIDLRAPPPGNA